MAFFAPAWPKPSRRDCLAALMAVGWPGLGMAQPAEPGGGGHGTRLHFDVEGRPAVHVAAGEGAVPLTLIVDTGANRTVLEPDVAAQLGLTPRPDQPVFGIAGITQAPVAHLSRLAIGDFARTDLEVALIGGRVLAGAHGLLGMDFFARRRLTLDYANERLLIGGSASLRMRDRMVVAPGELIHGALMILNVWMGRHSVRALVDTGANHTLINPSLTELLGAAADATGETSRAATATGAARLHVMQLPQLAVGELRVRRLVAFMADLDVFSLWTQPDEPAMVLGMNVWRLAEEMSLDYPRSELQLRLPARGPPVTVRPA
jgi:predicted aspartyl protease